MQTFVFRGLRAALLILASVSIPEPAAAQGATAAAREEASMKIGQLLLRPTFTITNVGVDTNVFNSADDPKSDFTATFAPHVDAWLPVARRALISTQLTAGLVYFKTFATERSVDPDVQMKVEVFMARLTLLSEGGFIHSRERPNLEIDARSRRNDSNFRIGARYSLTPKVGLELRGYRRDFRFDQDEFILGTNLRFALNRNERGFESRLGVVLTPKTSAFLAAETLRARFPLSSFKNADGFKAIGGLQFSPRALIAGTAEVGFKRFRPLSAVISDFNGLIAKTSVSSTILNSTKFGLTWDRDVAFSYELVQPYYLLNGFGGTVRRQLIRNSDVIVGAKRTEYEYRNLGSMVPGQPDAVRRDVSRVYTLDLGFRPNRQACAGVTISKSSRTSSNLSAKEYRGLRVGVSLTYGIQ